jgi:hypothetical protein
MAIGAIDGWSSKFAALIREARDSLLAEADTRGNAIQKEYALLTRAWPVDSAIGGTIAITEEGNVVCVDHDTDKVEMVYDRNVIKLALICASEKIADFRQLLPAKPAKFYSCAMCEGQGFVGTVENPKTLRCGRCLGLGWNVRP